MMTNFCFFPNRLKITVKSVESARENKSLRKDKIKFLVKQFCFLRTKILYGGKKKKRKEEKKKYNNYVNIKTKYAFAKTII